MLRCVPHLLDPPPRASSQAELLELQLQPEGVHERAQSLPRRGGGTLAFRDPLEERGRLVLELREILQENTDAKDVRGAAACAAQALVELGSVVLSRPPGSLQAEKLACLLGHPEVYDGDFEASRGPPGADVVALDVVVHHLPRVDGADGFHDLDSDPNLVLEGQLDSRALPFPQGRAAVAGDDQRPLEAHAHEALDARDPLERGQDESLVDRGSI